MRKRKEKQTEPYQKPTIDEDTTNCILCGSPLTRVEIGKGLAAGGIPWFTCDRCRVGGSEK